MAVIDLDNQRNQANNNNPWTPGGNSGSGGGRAGGGLPNIPGSSFLKMLGVIALVALALLVWTGIYTVPSDSIGVVTRFGAQTLTEQKQMVTGDLNAALVEWVVQYRIAEPKKYLFDVRSPAETLRDVSESVMRAVVGDRTVDEVITIGRQEIEDEALTKMQELTSKYGIGVSIDQVQLKNINPPRPVQESFNEVNQAQQEKESLINAARREYNKVIPLAEGEKDQRIRAADGYRLKRINEAEGDASRFTAVFAEYQKAPEVTRRRIYIETLQEVLPGLESKIIVDENSQQVLPLINLTNQKEVIK